MKKWLLNFKVLFTIPYFRRQFVIARIFYFVTIKKRLKTKDSEEAFDVTVTHNLKSLKMCNNRMDLLIKPISVIETLNEGSKILVIGPRNENDLFSLLGHGFAWHNIYGLDLITYSKRIVLGDMHNMEFADNFFDAVLCGWTLSYSGKPEIAAKEILRVTKNGGLIGIGVEYSTATKEDSEHLLGYSIQEYDKLLKRVNSTEQILHLFQGNIDHVFYDHDAPNKISHTRNGLAYNVSNVAAIFSVKKEFTNSN